jgi:hypothetical protein
VDFSKPAHLLHLLPLRDGGYGEVQVHPVGTRHFHLDPYPFTEPSMSFQFPARHVEGRLFDSATELQQQFAKAPVEMLSVTLTAS